MRGFAVEALERTDDEELRYYLLQLVQALRYEAEDDSRLAKFIVHRASLNPVLGILLHWSALSDSLPLPHPWASTAFSSAAYNMLSDFHGYLTKIEMSSPGRLFAAKPLIEVA